MERDKRLKDTKERLFAAALDLFAEKGVDAVSIRDIVGRVGISAAAFYNHFESKDQLLQAVYDFYREKLIRSTSGQGPDLGSLIEKLDPAELFALYTERFRIAMDNPLLAKLGRIITMEKNRNGVAAEISFNDRQLLIRSMEELFVAMEKKGRIRRGNARLLGRMFGYIQLGIAEDNMYYRYMKGMEVDEVVNRQNETMKTFLAELIGG